MTDNKPIIDVLSNMNRSERFVFFERFVRDQFNKHLHIVSPNNLLSDVSFFEQGLTSLGATEIQYQLEHACSIKLNSTTLFNFPTLESLLTHLTEQQLPTLFDAPSGKKTTNKHDLSLPEDLYAKHVLSDIFNL